MGALLKTNGNFFPTIPSVFDDLFTKDLFNWSNLNRAYGDTLPAVNIKETNDSFELEVAAPGMTKKDFNVELDNNTLVITAERKKKSEDKDEDGNYTRREFSYQSFRRSFTLPERMVKGEQITAKYNDGILHITVPKTEDVKVKPARKIQIS